MIQENDNTYVLEKMAKIQSMLDEEQSKLPNERDKERELQLIYARLLEGCKLNYYR
jgi:hypothetical protein